MAKIKNIIRKGVKVANKKVNIKPKAFLPAMVLIPSFYYSFSFTGGIVVGYAFARAFCHFFVHNGKINSVFIDYGKWKIHFHHWIMGVILLALVWILDQYYLPTLFAGFICGIIIQDIYDYNDWHQVVMKNNNKKEQATV